MKKLAVDKLDRFLSTNPEMVDIIDWVRLSRSRELSKPFIEKYAGKLNWYYMSRHQKLSEQLIEKHAGELNWDYISRYQKLSPEFVMNHIDLITRSIFENKHFKKYPESVKLLLKQRFNIKEVK
jgi:hypothetical protein